MTKNYLVEFYYNCIASESDFDNSNFCSCFKNTQFHLADIPQFSLFSSYLSAYAYVQCQLECEMDECDIVLTDISSDDLSTTRYYNSRFFSVTIRITELNVND